MHLLSSIEETFSLSILKSRWRKSRSNQAQTTKLLDGGSDGTGVVGTGAGAGACVLGGKLGGNVERVAALWVTE